MKKNKRYVNERFLGSTLEFDNIHGPDGLFDKNYVDYILKGV